MALEIQPAHSRLTAISMDDLFEQATKALLDRDGDARPALDLGKVEFFDPYAVASLCILVEHLAAVTGETPKVLLPNNLNVRGYLRRMKVLDRLATLAELDAPAGDSSGNPDSDLLLELTRIDSKSKIEQATEHLLQIVSANLGYKRKNINAVTNTISELCFNVLDHSEGTGWAVAQRYHRADGSRFVAIGVADGGVGIKKSLSTRYQTRFWSHFDAIVNALKKKFSRFPKRGFGLHMVKKIVFDFGGNLHIRTGDSRLYLAAKPKGFQGAMFPGTQIGISLSEHAGA